MSRSLIGVCVFVCAASSMLCAQSALEFDREVELARAAHSKAEYELAVEHLRRAILLNEKSPKAYVQLGNVYRDWYCPCDCDSKADCDANEKRRTDAIDAYTAALNLDASEVEALNSLGYLSRVHANLKASAGFYRRTLNVQPTNTEALYSLAAIDSTMSYRSRAETESKIGMKMHSRLIDHPACGDVRSENLARVEEGIELLQRTADVNKLTDSMSWLSVLYRERADIECGDRLAYEKDGRTSKQWTGRACAARRSGARASVPGPYPWPPAPPPPPGLKCEPKR